MRAGCLLRCSLLPEPEGPDFPRDGEIVNRNPPVLAARARGRRGERALEGRPIDGSLREQREQALFSRPGVELDRKGNAPLAARQPKRNGPWRAVRHDGVGVIEPQ